MSEKRTIETLIPDIHDLLTMKSHTIDRDNLAKFLTEMETTLIEYVEKEREVNKEKDLLRVSKLGTPLRKAWYEARDIETYNSSIDEPSDNQGESFDGSQMLRFMTGHIIESLLLFLAREAGHTVEYEQEEIVLDNDVKGHLDCVIDGHLVDVKTASHFGYVKFVSGDLVWGDDPFGYVAQLSGYKQGLEQKHNIKLNKPSFFWAYNKSNSEQVLTPIEHGHLIDAEDKVRKLKEAIGQDSPPATKCYDPVPHGKSGNMQIHKNCNYCKFKEDCWKDSNDGKGLRKFQYSKDIVHLTHVEAEPKVQEIE